MSILVGAIVDNPPPAKSRRAERCAAPGRPTMPPGRYSSYDAAATTDDNRKHFANADNLSALWANSPGVRRLLRNRSRFERGNNGYLKNAVKTSRNDIVGTCPTRKAKLDNAEHAAWVDQEFAAWCRAVGFGWKCRTAATAYKGDGEAVALFVTNSAIAGPVQLDIRLIEAEMLASPLSAFGANGVVYDRFGNIAEYMADGVIFDKLGNVTEYHVLKNHPGDGYVFDPLAFDRYAPEFVLHWYERDRPGQVRGVPDTVPALPLCAMSRRFTLASLQAAEIQAAFAGVLETPALPDDGTPAESIPGIEIEHGMIPSLPEGYKLNALQSTQPTAMYGEFKREVLAEQGAGMGQPYNRVARDSTRHSYSSARLDTQERQDDIEIEREDFVCFWSEPVFQAWQREASLIPGYAPEGLDLSQPIPGDWHFRGFGYIDPVKEITATLMALKACLTSLKTEYAKQGKDWKAEIDQIAIEREYLASKNLTIEDVAGPATQKPDRQDTPDDAEATPPAPVPNKPARRAPKPAPGGYAWTR